MSNNILLFAKFGERQYMERLADGEVYFSLADKFIKQEQEQQQKGQGDAFEGRMNIMAFDVKMYDPDTNELLYEIPNVNLNLGFEYVANMPIFCLTAGYSSDCDFVADNRCVIKFSKDKEKIIREHFSKADTALIIKKPDLFIQDVQEAFTVLCYADTVKYFDMSVLTTDRMNYLQTGSLEKIKVSSFSMTVDNIYRHLYCKDNFFKDQAEFRFVVPKLHIDKPQTFNIKMRSDIQLFDLDEFFNGVEILL